MWSSYRVYCSRSTISCWQEPIDERKRPSADTLAGDERHLRAALVSSQIIGVAMTRSAWRVGALAEVPPEEVARYVAPTIQRYLSGQL